MVWRFNKATPSLFAETCVAETDLDWIGSVTFLSLRTNILYRWKKTSELKKRKSDMYPATADPQFSGVGPKCSTAFNPDSVTQKLNPDLRHWPQQTNLIFLPRELLSFILLLVLPRQSPISLVFVWSPPPPFCISNDQFIKYQLG